MSHVIEDKKERKKAVLKRNRFHQELFNFLRLRRAEEERVQEMGDAMKPRPAASQDDDIGDKVAAIRNRLTGSKRLSRERWNRFAGTSGGGGRGL